MVLQLENITVVAPIGTMTFWILSFGGYTDKHSNCFLLLNIIGIYLNSLYFLLYPDMDWKGHLFCNQIIMVSYEQI